MIDRIIIKDIMVDNMSNTKKVHYIEYNEGWISDNQKRLILKDRYTACGYDYLYGKNDYIQITNNFNDITCKNCKKANK